MIPQPVVGLGRLWPPRPRVGPLDSQVDPGRAIIDTMMNPDLLFWASAETADERSAGIARRHAATSAAHHWFLGHLLERVTSLPTTRSTCR
ncbi:MAG: hypothetical protein ACRD0K_09625 [Egibacteraceae bacterium]